MYALLWRIFMCTCKKKCVSCSWWNILQLSLRSSWLLVFTGLLFTWVSSVSSSNHYLKYAKNSEKATIFELSVSSFNYVSFCFMYFKVMLLNLYVFTAVTSSCGLAFCVIIKCPLSPVIVFVFKSLYAVLCGNIPS